jgi:hypothetical protein
MLISNSSVASMPLVFSTFFVIGGGAGGANDGGDKDDDAGSVDTELADPDAGPCVLFWSVCIVVVACARACVWLRCSVQYQIPDVAI